MPYRVDLARAPSDVLDRLVDLGALDIETNGQGGVAALMPDTVSADRLTDALGLDSIQFTPARGRDDDSVWVLSPGPRRHGRLQIVPADGPPLAGALRLIDGVAFGTGLHPTTTLSLDALERELDTTPPASLLDVGTGSGILALAALHDGVPNAVALDIDVGATTAAQANARLNGLSSRLHVVQGGPEAVAGHWPFVVANILAAPLVEMAPALTRLVAPGGRLVLSGIRTSLSPEVEHAYRHAGLRQIDARTRDAWTALTFVRPALQPRGR